MTVFDDIINADIVTGHDMAQEVTVDDVHAALDTITENMILGEHDYPAARARSVSAPQAMRAAYMTEMDFEPNPRDMALNDVRALIYAAALCDNPAVAQIAAHGLELLFYDDRGSRFGGPGGRQDYINAYNEALGPDGYLALNPGWTQSSTPCYQDYVDRLGELAFPGSEQYTSLGYVPELGGVRIPLLQQPEDAWTRPDETAVNSMTPFVFIRDALDASAHGLLISGAHQMAQAITVSDVRGALDAITAHLVAGSQAEAQEPLDHDTTSNQAITVSGGDDEHTTMIARRKARAIAQAEARAQVPLDHLIALDYVRDLIYASALCNNPTVTAEAAYGLEQIFYANDSRFSGHGDRENYREDYREAYEAAIELLHYEWVFVGDDDDEDLPPEAKDGLKRIAGSAVLDSATFPGSERYYKQFHRNGGLGIVIPQPSEGAWQRPPEATSSQTTTLHSPASSPLRPPQSPDDPAPLPL